MMLTFFTFFLTATTLNLTATTLKLTVKIRSKFFEFQKNSIEFCHNIPQKQDFFHSVSSITSNLNTKFTSSKMSSSETEQQKEERLLYVVTRAIPAHTGKHAGNFTGDKFIKPLMLYHKSESDEGLQSKVHKVLHDKRVSIESARTANDALRNAMTELNEDEVIPIKNTFQEAEENEQKCEEEVARISEHNAKRWEEMKKEFEKWQNQAMEAPIAALNKARKDTNEKSKELNEVIDKSK